LYTSPTFVPCNREDLVVYWVGPSVEPWLTRSPSACTSLGEPVALLALLDSVPLNTRRVLRDPNLLPAEHELLALLLIKDAGHPLGKVTPALGRSEVATILRDQLELVISLNYWPVSMNTTLKRSSKSTPITSHSTATSPAGCFDGDVLYFRATRDKPADDFGRDRWWSLIRGDIETHDIDCEHETMTQPEPIAEIGRILADHLEDIDNPQRSRQ
jgi:thioesterase domain-containing protein